MQNGENRTFFNTHKKQTSGRWLDKVDADDLHAETRGLLAGDETSAATADHDQVVLVRLDIYRGLHFRRF